MIIDVIYDNEEIYHVLEPNLEGIRGVPVTQLFIRDTIENVRIHLAHLDQAKINDFEFNFKNKIL